MEYAELPPNFRQCLDKARAAFAKDRFHVPILSAFTKRAVWIVDVSELINVKPAVEELMIEFARKGAKELVLVTEGWSLRGTAENAERNAEYCKHHLIADHPDRVEVLTVSYESRKLRTSAFAEIMRDGDKPSLGRWNISDPLPNDPAEFGGPPRMQYIFSKLGPGRG